MARLGTKPLLTKVNKTVRTDLTANEKLPAGEFVYIGDRVLYPRTRAAFTETIKADDEYTFNTYTQSGALNFVKDALSALPDTNIGNGTKGIIIADGSAINFSSDFDILAPSSYVASDRYLLDVFWNGTKFVGTITALSALFYKTIFIDAAVAPGGNGAINTPFDTIQNAISTINDGDVVYIRGDVGILNTLPTPYSKGFTVIGLDPSADIQLFSVFGTSAALKFQFFNCTVSIDIATTFACEYYFNNCLVRGNVDLTGGKIFHANNCRFQKTTGAAQNLRMNQAGAEIVFTNCVDVGTPVGRTTIDDGAIVLSRCEFKGCRFTKDHFRLTLANSDATLDHSTIIAPNVSTSWTVQNLIKSYTYVEFVSASISTTTFGPDEDQISTDITDLQEKFTTDDTVTFFGTVRGGIKNKSFTTTPQFLGTEGNIQKMVVTDNLVSIRGGGATFVDGASYIFILEIGGSGSYTIPEVSGPPNGFGPRTDNSVDDSAPSWYPTTVGSKIIYTVICEPDGDRHYSIETITS